MKALVLWAEKDSANLGVRALGEGSVALLRQVWPDVDVSFQGNRPGDAPIEIMHPRAVVEHLASRQGDLRSWISGFDVVLDTRAGDSFADIYGLYRLTSMSVVAEVVRSTDVPLVMAPQTIGPFRTRRGRELGRWSLRRASCVMARDSLSAGYAAGLGRAVDVVATDMVFALPVPVRERTLDVALNVSGLLWQPNPHVDSTRYRATIRDLIRALTDRGRRVTLLPHVLDSPVADNDIPVAESLAVEYGGAVDVVVPKSLTDVRETLASATVAIGSRMHACLNAISVGTPALPLAYSRKFLPLLNDIGWYHTIDLRSDDSGAENIVAALESTSLTAGTGPTVERAAELLEPAHRALRTLV
jgi:colanic acid/amylovoran biosynthesis protein